MFNWPSDTGVTLETAIRLGLTLNLVSEGAPSTGINAVSN